MLVAAPRLSDPVPLAAGVRTKTIVAGHLAACEWSAAALAIAKRFATADVPGCFGRSTSPGALLGIVAASLVGLAHLFDGLRGMLPSESAGGGAVSARPVVLPMAARTERHPVVGIVGSSGVIPFRFDVSAFEEPVESSAVLALSVRSSQNCEFPRPSPLFGRRVSPQGHDVFVSDHESDCNSHIGHKGGDA